MVPPRRFAQGVARPTCRLWKRRPKADAFSAENERSRSGERRSRDQPVDQKLHEFNDTVPRILTVELDCRLAWMYDSK
jgi:hypothetical protein